jgi:hypothetical protein
MLMIDVWLFELLGGEGEGDVMGEGSYDLGEVGDDHD